MPPTTQLGDAEERQIKVEDVDDAQLAGSGKERIASTRF